MVVVKIYVLTLQEVSCVHVVEVATDLISHHVLVNFIVIHLHIHSCMSVLEQITYVHNIMFICYTPPCIELHGIVIFRSSLLSADINECEVMQHNCTAMQERCVNIDGGFSCECESGFTGNSTVGDGCYSKLVIGTI